MEMEDMSLEVAERDTAAEIAAEAAVTTTSATTATPTPDHNHYRPSHHHRQHHARSSSGSAIPAAPPGDAAHRRTCQPCRLRKVKCIAGEGPACANCERLGFTCSFAGPSPQAEGAGAGGPLSLPRRRVRLACSSCHSRKARCSGDTPKCKRCRSQGLECVYRPTKRSGGPGGDGESAGATTTPPGHAGDSEHESAASEPPEKRRHVRDDRVPGHGKSHSLSLGQGGHGPWALNHEPINFPDEVLISRTFDNFFRHVHHVPVFSFLHRASLMQRYHAGMMDKALLLALVGITSLLTDLGPGAREYGGRCIDECQRMVLGDMENPSTIKIQALVFIMKYRMLTRRFTGAFMLAALVSRFSYALRLNYENPNLCFLARESRRRLMWAFMTIDSGINGGYPDFTLLPAEAMHIQLPCNERNFEFDLPQITEHLRPVPTRPFPDDVGSLALHVRLLWVRSRVLYCTKNVLAMPETELRELPRLVDTLAGELRAFNEHLPASFRFSDNNVKLRAYSPRLCVFIMIHVWWRQCHCDLYRVVLSGLKEALPHQARDRLPPQFVDLCQRQCFEHALATADIFRTIMSLDGGLPVTDADLAMCAYQCARMLFFGYRTPAGQDQATVEQIHEHAQRCLRITKHMSHLPAVQDIHSDLENLIARGISATNTPSYPSSPDAARLAMSGQPGLSRHNTMRQIDISDMNELMPSPPVRASPALPVTASSPSVYSHPALGGTPGGGGSTTTTTTPLQHHRTTPPAAAARAAAFSDLAPTHIVSLPKPAGAAQHHPLLPPVDPPEGLDNNNAFEGAMDGFDFNFESFGNTGSEAISWFADPSWVVNGSGSGDYSSTTA